MRFQDRVARLAQLGPVLLQTSEKGVIPVIVFEVTAKLAHIAAARSVFVRRAALRDVDFGAVAALRESRRWCGGEYEGKREDGLAQHSLSPDIFLPKP
jgi:hypothetical protein